MLVDRARSAFTIRQSAIPAVAGLDDVQYRAPGILDVAFQVAKTDPDTEPTRDIRFGRKVRKFSLTHLLQVRPIVLYDRSQRSGRIQYGFSRQTTLDVDGAPAAAIAVRRQGSTTMPVTASSPPTRKARSKLSTSSRTQCSPRSGRFGSDREPVVRRRSRAAPAIYMASSIIPFSDLAGAAEEIALACSQSPLRCLTGAVPAGPIPARRSLLQNVRCGLAEPETLWSDRRHIRWRLRP
ncbi:hypothetical protein JAN5088_00623 [Jannaschia rubra]|uniref:Uncharacterized protein n=1 Tax=Jannaschia rubra TaxID=282197 RepID=A0A0M6XPB0_9RHOB|nr:hypothetical protein JAN5088_00623 [Jannaschia rubra]SFG77580.1 hypothetical protein SAMN04488517_1153 [Jannaschia rubra]